MEPGHMLNKTVVHSISLASVPKAADEIYLVFSPSRGVPLKALIDDGTSRRPLPGQSVRVGSHALKVTLTPEARAQKRVSLRIISRDEPVELARVLFARKGDEKHVIAMADADKCGTQKPEGIGSDNPAKPIFSRETFGQELQHELDSRPHDPLTPQRRYFALLDQQSNSTLMPNPELAQAISVLTNELRRRVEIRRMKFESDPQNLNEPQPTPGTLLLRRLAAQASKIQLDLIEFCFPSKLGVGFDLAAYEEAFENFAAGQLRFRVPSSGWTTQPSSYYFFFFAEFAFLACDLDIRAADWSRLANVMTRTQPLYCRMYAPHSAASPNWVDYAACNFDGKVATNTIDKWKTELRAQYRRIDPAQLRMKAGANAAAALAPRASSQSPVTV
jgi:hypothetical protein